MGMADEKKEKASHWGIKYVVPICLWLLLGNGITLSILFYLKGRAAQTETQTIASQIETEKENMKKLETQDESAKQQLNEILKEEEEKNEELKKIIAERKEEIHEMERKIKDIDATRESLQ